MRIASILYNYCYIWNIEQVISNLSKLALIESGWPRNGHQSFPPSVQNSFMSSHQVSSHPTYQSDPFSQPMLNILNPNNSVGHPNASANDFQYSGHNTSEGIAPSPWTSTTLSSARNISDSNSWAHSAFVAPNSGYQTNSYFIWKLKYQITENEFNL